MNKNLKIKIDKKTGEVKYDFLDNIFAPLNDYPIKPSRRGKRKLT